MEKKEYYCETCEKNVKIKSRSQHEKTLKHLKKIGKENEYYGECKICYELLRKKCSCISCKQKWCNVCDEKVSRCPYCRVLIPGREQQDEKINHERLDWYFNENTIEMNINRTLNTMVDRVLDEFVDYLVSTRSIIYNSIETEQSASDMQSVISSVFDSFISGSDFSSVQHITPFTSSVASSEHSTLSPIISSSVPSRYSTISSEYSEISLFQNQNLNDIFNRTVLNPFLSSVNNIVNNTTARLINTFSSQSQVQRVQNPQQNPVILSNIEELESLLPNLIRENQTQYDTFRIIFTRRP
jgi:hypothetical protein